MKTYWVHYRNIYATTPMDHVTRRDGTSQKDIRAKWRKDNPSYLRITRIELRSQ